MRDGRDVAHPTAPLFMLTLLAVCRLSGGRGGRFSMAMAAVAADVCMRATCRHCGLDAAANHRGGGLMFRAVTRLAQQHVGGCGTALLPSCTAPIYQRAWHVSPFCGTHRPICPNCMWGVAYCANAHHVAACARTLVNAPRSVCTRARVLSPTRGVGHVYQAAVKPLARAQPPAKRCAPL